MIRPRRSVLYMPGSNSRAMEKARSLAADTVILDLEDAVSPDAKEAARAQVCATVRARSFGTREVVIRINALATAWGLADLVAVAECEPDAILIPKVSTANDLAAVEGHLDARHVRLALWAMIETPLAILNLGTIAAAGGRLACLVMGTNDLIKELRAQHTPDRMNLAAALGLSVAAARANGLGIVDGVYNDVQDGDGFIRSCHQARTFGFDGKTLIHPSQIGPCNDAFAPTPDEIEQARRIIAAFDRPENRGRGAIAVDGRMVELLHMAVARQTVELADAIAALSAET